MDYTRLDFPLNVYAHSLYLQQGQVEYLHFGLVEEQEDAWQIGALAAQRRATELLIRHLPPPPCKLLEIGLGLGTLAAELADLGYEVTAISPDPYQIAIAETRVKNRAVLECLRFEEFNPPPQSFDVIVFQESAQYISSLTLFNRAFEWLRGNGRIVIMDEVSLRRTAADGPDSLPLLRYTLGQAERCGFKLIEQLDLTKQAAPTVDYLLRVIKMHEQSLLQATELTEHDLENLFKSLHLYQEKYREGRYGYVLLVLQKIEPPRWRLTEVTSHEQEAMRALFQQVFGHELTSALWHWKYGDGRGMAIGAWQGDKMVAHYGGIVRELRYFGIPKKGVQIVDVMVAVRERGMLTRRGAYFMVGATFPECYAGYGSKILLGFGFPTQRAIHTAELLGLYEDVGRVTEVRWSTTGGRPRLGSRVRHINPHDHEGDGGLINQLWEQMHPQLKHAIIGVRDWHYIQHRYLAHPHKRYELLLVTQRFTGKPFGVIVLHRDEDADICKLLDIIGPLDYLHILLQQARRMAGNWGMHTLTLWVTENFADLFIRTGGEAHHVDVRIPHCLWYEGPPTTEVRGKWWLIGGDTDFM